MSLDEPTSMSHKKHNNLQQQLLLKVYGDEIFVTTKLTASAGIAPNKMIAKIASDINKPDGLTIVKPNDCFTFMQPLSLKKFRLLALSPIINLPLSSY